MKGLAKVNMTWLLSFKDSATTAHRVCVVLQFSPYYFNIAELQ